MQEVYYFLNSVDLTKYQSGSTIPHIYFKDYSKELILVPPLLQQQKIVSVLDTASALVEKQKALLKKYDLFLKSKFIEMFGDPVKNPMGWKISPISEVCSDIVDCVNRTAEIVDYITPYKMIRTTNVRNHRISLKDARCVEEDIYKTWIRRLKPQRGDLVFTREAPVGEAGIIDFDDEVFLGQRTMLFRPDTSLTNPYYLLFEMMGENLKYQMDKISAGSVVKHLSVPDCKKFTIHRPPISLQNQFAKIVEQTETLKQKEQQKLEKLQTLYDASMSRAFKGEIE
jgi:type I restriction enzyme S subunit